MYILSWGRHTNTAEETGYGWEGIGDNDNDKDGRQQKQF